MNAVAILRDAYVLYSNLAFRHVACCEESLPDFPSAIVRVLVLENERHWSFRLRLRLSNRLVGSLFGYLLFVSVLGGIEVFGLLGLVAGPTIVAAAMGVFRVYMQHRDDLETARV